MGASASCVDCGRSLSRYRYGYYAECYADCYDDCTCPLIYECGLCGDIHESNRTNVCISEAVESYEASHYGFVPQEEVTAFWLRVRDKAYSDLTAKRALQSAKNARAVSVATDQKYAAQRDARQEAAQQRQPYRHEPVECEWTDEHTLAALFAGGFILITCLLIYVT